MVSGRCALGLTRVATLLLLVPVVRQTRREFFDRAGAGFRQRTSGRRARASRPVEKGSRDALSELKPNLRLHGPWINVRVRHAESRVTRPQPRGDRIAIRIERQIRNRHGISAYGTNTKEQQIEFGAVRRGDLLEVIFSFNCWLGVDDYSITCAVHNRNGEAFDWIDGARFFRVASEAVTEGVANLNATVSARHVPSAASLKIQDKLAV